jgi:choline dehydrogenase-like flavoprotein
MVENSTGTAVAFSVRPVMDIIARFDAKMDAEIAALRRALASENVRLLTETHCLQILTTSDGSRVTGVLLRYSGREQIVHASVVVLCTGLVGSVSLLRVRSLLSGPFGGNNVPACQLEAGAQAV